jgi:hypothetical protein
MAHSDFLARNDVIAALPPGEHKTAFEVSESARLH